MNWYKKAQSVTPIQYLGFKIYKPEVTGEMYILFGGNRKYTYHGIYEDEANHMSSLLAKKNYRAAGQKLRDYKTRYDNQQAQTTGYTSEEEQQMLDELEQNGLIGNL